MNPSLHPPILSEDFSDIIFRYQNTSDRLTTLLESYGSQRVNDQYQILHAPLSMNLFSTEAIGYPAVPKLYTQTNTVSLEQSGILSVQLQPYLNLTGKNVLLGFLDSGIDYTHPAFRRSDGQTRILRIWDQTDQSGQPPYDLGYGSEYQEASINQALFSAAPRDIVPVTDSNGHGTAVAGIACGSADAAEDFTGAAPEAMIAFVRLKPAKQYLRDYFRIPEQSLAYQETDLMLGVRYLLQTARELRLPLVLCISLGSNQGGHTGTTPLEEILISAQFNTGVYVVTGTGNEVGAGHHYLGRSDPEIPAVDIELLIEQETHGFSLEFWADAPELYSIGFTSPLGETIQPIQPRSGTSIESSFLLESSRVILTYSIVEPLSGAQLALLRFFDPTPGIWRIRVVNQNFVSGRFHMWLPISGLVNPDIRFYTPDSNTTLTTPSCAAPLLTVSTYNAYNNSLFVNSGRGYTRNHLIKPDLAAPGVNLSAPAPEGTYTQLTGSSAASALTAGAAALLVEAGLRQLDPRYFTASELKSLFLRGTSRIPGEIYPNREWGYGTLDVYGIFESFLRS